MVIPLTATQRLTMRCSEPLRLARALRSHPATFAHPAAQVTRQPPRSLSLGRAIASN